MKKKLLVSFINFVTHSLPLGLLKPGMPSKFILCGHLISDHWHPAARLYKYPSPAEFEQAIQWIRSLGYRFVDLTEYNLPGNDKKVLLTFDDGFKVIKEETHAFLKQHNIPYVIFIMTDSLWDREFSMDQNLGDPSFVDFRGRFLSPEEILFLKSEGVHIGFHGRNHSRVGTQPRHHDDIIKQMTIPREYIHLFSEPLCFAYPYSAPPKYEAFNLHLDQLGFKNIFDTRGFYSQEGNHLYRVSIDTMNRAATGNWIQFVIKKKLILSMLNKILYKTRGGDSY